MATFLTYSGKQVKLRTQAAVYEAYIQVVAGTAGANQIQGPITNGTAITLPNSRSFTGAELTVRYNGVDLVYLLDYTYVGSGPTYTQVSLNFTVNGNDTYPNVLEFYIDRDLS